MLLRWKAMEVSEDDDDDSDAGNDGGVILLQEGDKPTLLAVAVCMLLIYSQSTH